ncbi:capsid cement protein [uncultured Tessaracoccus sp.]|uniref:capsid cement protein n=1 Tax=uncultured Tessaracoccus sp. TaxID=905023 RepID=UPI002606CC43|nr:capsid cement protein [uncultured Tessaracoccus sp.]
MADYLPLFKPGQTVTMTASAKVEGGMAVEVTGDRRVGPAGAASKKYVGVAGHSAAAEEKVTVHLRSHVQRIKAAGGIAAGDTVECGADGTVKTGSTAPIGIALAAAQAGELAQIKD